MSRLILALFAVLAIFSVSTIAKSHDCPPNQEYTVCGSACEPSCSAHRQTVCTFECKIGCQCKEGFLRNSLNECVSPQQCH